MAVNVFLVFFTNADPALFQRYTWVYWIICFGGPMVPAIVLVSVRGDPKGPMIGDAAVSAIFPLGNFNRTLLLILTPCKVMVLDKS